MIMYLSLRPIRKFVPGLILAVLTVLCWASFNVAAVHGVRSGFTPLDLTLIRYGVSGAILATAAAIMLGTSSRRPDHGSLLPWGRSLLLAVLGGPIFGFVSVAGYLFAPLSHGMIFAPATVFAIGTLLAVRMNNEPLHPHHIIGGVIGLAGLVVLAGGELRTSGPLTLGGDALFVLAGAMWALFTALQRRWNIDPLRGLVAIGTFSGLLAPLIFAVGLSLGFGSFLLDAPLEEIVLQAVMQGIIGGIVSVGALIATVKLLGTASAAGRTRAG